MSFALVPGNQMWVVRQTSGMEYLAIVLEMLDSTFWARRQQHTRERYLSRFTGTRCPAMCRNSSMPVDTSPVHASPCYFSGLSMLAIRRHADLSLGMQLRMFIKFSWAWQWCDQSFFDSGEGELKAHQSVLPWLCIHWGFPQVLSHHSSLIISWLDCKDNFC